MDNITDKIQRLAKRLGKTAPTDPEYINYQELRKGYEKKANQDIQKIQKDSKKERVLAIQGQADLNPKWRFDNLVADSDDVNEALDVANSFIGAHNDPSWRNNSSHMMIFYGDYGRGKSHIAGAIAHELIEQYEITVLYRQLSTLLDMRLFSYDFSATDGASEQYRKIQHELLNVDLLVLDEVCVNETMLKKNAQSWLGNILRQRLVNHKNCILITNHDLASLETAVGKYCFESIKEYDSYRVRFSGPSRREVIVPEGVTSTPINPQAYTPNQVK